MARQKVIGPNDSYVFEAFRVGSIIYLSIMVLMLIIATIDVGFFLD